VICIEKDAVLRARIDGSSFTRVLRGSNPLLLNVDGSAARIEWIQQWSFGGSTDLPESLLENVDVFAVSDNPSAPRFADRIFMSLKARIPHLDFTLWMEREPWYPFADNAPLVSPFSTLSSIPESDAYRTSAGVHCSVSGSVLRCRVRRASP
jgi:hypothetical protein